MTNAMLAKNAVPSLWRLSFTLCSLVSLGLLTVTGRGNEPALEVGLQKQLLVDDFIIASKSNLSRVLQPAIKENGGRPIMVPDKPWEDDYFGFYGTVLHDGQKFRMWYTCWPYAIAYAESLDGLHWKKPNLGLYDFSIERANREPGSDIGFEPRQGMNQDYRGTDNNIVGFFGDGFTCFLDPNETDPQHRYKACYGHLPKICACIAHSPDGIHWTAYNNGEPVTGRASDSYNQVLWDEKARTYRLFTRTDFDINGVEVRGNRGMTNPDLKANPTNWQEIRSWRFDREGVEEYQRRQIYGLTDWIYENVHFALLMVYEWPDDPPLNSEDLDYEKRHEKDVMNFYIATSRDGDNWDLTWVYAKQPLIERGPDGSFDKDMIQAASSIVTWKDKHWIYYGGSRERHWRYPKKSSIGVATLPLDRFIALQAKGGEGTLVTRPFKLEGSALEINADADDGQIAVEVLDEHGKPIAGLSLADCRQLENVDGLSLRPTWSGKKLRQIQGTTIQLKFYLQNAKLYAFQIRP